MAQTTSSMAIPPRFVDVEGNSRLTNSLILLGSAGVLVVLYFFNPVQFSFYPRCTFHETTGLLCPGCGGLRAMHQLLHGHFVEAVRYNALLVGFLPGAVFLATRFALSRFRGVPTSVMVRPLWLWVGLVILISFGIARNLPGFPTSWIPPHVSRITLHPHV
jgi:hypothetical protein